MKNLSILLSVVLSGMAYGQVEFTTAALQERGNASTEQIEVTQAAPNALNDVAVLNLTLSKYGVINTDYPVGASIKNLGTNMVQSLKITWSDGTNSYTEEVTQVGLYGNQTRVINHPTALNYAAMTNKTITFTVVEVNGVPDTNPTDNTGTSYFSTVSQLSPKKVLIEEGTGTWCGFCPRGFVAMEAMDAQFPDDFIGIAVHNGDPMRVAAYDNAANFGGWPQMNVDRAKLRQNVSVNDMQSNINQRKSIISPAELTASGTLIGNTLNMTASAIFRANIDNANLRLSVILIEDGVTGTTNPNPGIRDGYAQVNYYAGGAYGPMGGWENLPNPVPASQMVYDHVGRMLIGGYAGQPGSVPTTVTDGQVVNFTLPETIIPAAYNTANMKAIILLLDGTSGEVVNGQSIVLKTLGTTNAETAKNYLTVYPNPTSDYFKVQSNYRVDVQVFDTSGKLVLSKTDIAADRSIPVHGLAKGVYMVRISEKGNGTKMKTQKLIIK